MASETLRARSDDLSWRELEGEGIVLDLRTQKYLSLNETGVALWRRLQEGATADQLVDGLAEEHAVDRPTAERDVAAFLAVLRERDLLA